MSKCGTATDRMSTVAYSQLRLRDGRRIYAFPGEEIAASSSERAGVQRWSELSVYCSGSGEFFLQKVGRTTVAHKPECRFVDHRMPSWLEAKEEAVVHRTPCTECQPPVGDQMDPHTRLEPQRYTLYRSPDLDGILAVLTAGHNGPQLPSVVARLINQVLAWERNHNTTAKAV